MDWLRVGDDPWELFVLPPRAVAVDAETTGLDYRSDVLGFSLSWRGAEGNVKSCYAHVPRGQMSISEMSAPPIALGEVMAMVADRHHVIYHNQAFDYRLQYKYFRLPPPPNTHDTMHMSMLVEAQPSRSLDALAERYLDVDRALSWYDVKPEWYQGMKKMRARLSSLPLSTVSTYARIDTDLTLLLAEELMARLRRSELVSKDLYLRDRNFARVVMGMIARGLPLNREWVNAKTEEIENRLSTIEQELAEMGLDRVGSNQQEAMWLYKTLGLYPVSGALVRTNVGTDEWPDGVPSVSKDALGVLPSHPGKDLLLEHRQLSKSMSSWFREFEAEAEHDGRVHSLLNPFGTVSFRMSASRPNVQAIPMNDRGRAFGSLRGVFTGAPDGGVLMELDVKQAEVRMAALLAAEQGIADGLARGEDPYEALAVQVWGDKSKRQSAKRALLAAIYEIGPATFSATHKVPEAEARAVLDDVRERAPALRRASVAARAQVEHQGYVLSWKGRPRFFTDAEPSYSGFNQRVQMGVAELMIDVMLAIEERWPGRLHLQVHDSVEVLVPGDDLAAQHDMVEGIRQTIMDCAPRLDGHPEIPFLVDAEPWE